MKIFISHASANKQYGNALVELLRGIGIGAESIIFTSNTAYGIPPSQNIFNWLKTQISEKPFVIYLLSKEYYASIACLNEMGAAWIIENEHAIVFTPGFDIDSKEFQNGAIDPREKGLFLDNHEKMLTFVELLKKHFTVTTNQVIIHQETESFLKKISEIPKTFIHRTAVAEVEKPQNSSTGALNNPFANIKINTAVEEAKSNPKTEKNIPGGIYQKFINDTLSGKLKDEELLLLQYIIDTGRIKLGIGWQEPPEVAKVHVWEEVNELNNKLSSNYGSAIGKFEIRGYTEVSAVTSSDNPKEVKLKAEIADNILELPQEILMRISKAVDDNQATDVNEFEF